MTRSDIAAAFSELKPRFLEGLAPVEMEAILAAAKVRRYIPKSVVTNQDHPAEHLFLLVSGNCLSTTMWIWSSQTNCVRAVLADRSLPR